MTTWNILAEAIRTRSSVRADYRGYRRDFSPHKLGFKGEAAHVLVFQFGGNSASGLPPGGQWRCMDVAALGRARVIGAHWRTGMTSGGRPQTCIDDVRFSVR